MVLRENVLIPNTCVKTLEFYSYFGFSRFISSLLRFSDKSESDRIKIHGFGTGTERFIELIWL